MRWLVRLRLRKLMLLGDGHVRRLGAAVAVDAIANGGRLVVWWRTRIRVRLIGTR